MVFFVGFLAVTAFAAAIYFSRIVSVAMIAVRRSQSVIAVIQDGNLEDEEKERKTQQAALAMFSLFARIMLAAFISLSTPVLVIWSSQALGLAKSEEVYSFILSWEAIVGFTVLSVPIVMFIRRK